MKLSFSPLMSDALRLTRSGNLKEATKAIQTALRGGETLEPSSPGSTETPRDDLASPLGEPRTLSRQPPSSGSQTKGTFEDKSYSGPAGTLTYRLYSPAGAKAGMPLVVMLHGCTQTPEDFARGTGMNQLADEFGFLVAYPRQTMAANAQKCWNWFKPGDQQRDRGEPALIAGATRQIVSDRVVDSARVYVAGLSAGGAAAAIMSEAYPDLFAAAGIHSGLACGSARDVPSALMAMKNGTGTVSKRRSGRFIPVITFHGDRDMTVNEINSREIVGGASSAAGSPLHTKIESGSRGGRTFSRKIAADAEDKVMIEQWTIHGAGHAWSGGNQAGSYADPSGPDASREMLRFFLTHRLRS